ncbi:MAG: hypothetical protein R3C60_09365 [Parvularculaceae bacterium]
MRSNNSLRALTLALLLSACSQGTNIASPGATNGGGTGGGGTGGGGTGGGSTVSCPAGTTVNGTIGTNTVCDVAGEILQDLTLPFLNNVVYHIAGRVDVGRDTGSQGNAANGASATLTIEPGVTLYGGSSTDILIVNRGSQINAVGTTSQPIVFTSMQDVQGLNDPTTASRQWGGVILLGNAPIRGCNSAVPAGSATCEDEIEGVTNATGRVALFGGDNPASNSGTMQYVQIRYPGAFLTSASAGDDLNGLSLGGIGSATTLDHIQIHNSGDDGIEVFGGTVNLGYIVLTGANDDTLDCDYGWTGAAQFVVISQTSIAGSGGPDGLIECSNASKLSTGGSLQTDPVIANFTFVGVPVSSSGGSTKGVEFNQSGGAPGASGQLYNGIITGASRCLSIDASETGSRGPADTANPPTVNSVEMDCAGWTPSTFAGQVIAAGTNNTTNVTNTLQNRFFPGSAETAVMPFPLGTLSNTFLTATSYIGAFSPTETVASNWAAGWTIQLLPVSGCPAGTTQGSPGSEVGGTTRCILAGQYDGSDANHPASIRLTPGFVYEISGRIDIGADRGADGMGGVGGSLTIDPGVTLFGNDASDLIIVNRGSTIVANGSASQPIIMTSLRDLTSATDTAASREWGGLILLGRAPIRGCNQAVVAGSATCEDEVEGVTNATGRVALFGGGDAADNSGTIRYLQIRYPGAFLTSAAAGDDLNGLTLGGVGSTTNLDHIQIHNSGDDGIEIFGGTVGMKYVILDGNHDDTLDCDYGWQGNMQFVLTIHNYETGTPDGLVECSNAAKSSLPATPAFQTDPIISNFTFIGSGGKGAAFDSAGGTPGARATLVNGVIANHPDASAVRCLSVDGSVGETGSGRGSSDGVTLDSVLFDCPGWTPSTLASTYISAGTNVTLGASSLAAPNAPARAVQTGPNWFRTEFVNGATEMGYTAVDPTTLGMFFSSGSYIGAVSGQSDNWWRTWSCGLEAADC